MELKLKVGTRIKFALGAWQRAYLTEDGADHGENWEITGIDGGTYTVIPSLSNNLDSDITVYAYDSEFDVCSDTDTDSVAVKLDDNKPMMSLIPQAALKEVAMVLNFGAAKYSKNNWRKGMDWSRLQDAALRHLGSHIDGEDKDPESKLSHLAHLACCTLFLLEYELKGLGNDDRPDKD